MPCILLVPSYLENSPIIVSTTINAGLEDFLAVFIALFISDYGIVSYYEPVIQLMLMVFLMFFINSNKKVGTTDENQG